ncbi:MAG: OmpH family outer membrane protein [Flavobacteriales bacterium]|nr:OmpH family outer membrane protein [Flavobacteriales bacterium]
MKYIIAILAIALLSSCSEKKDAYVQVSKLYAEFDMTKEHQKKLQQSVTIKTQLLDSLKLQLQQLELQLNSGKSDELIQAYQMKKQEYLYKEKSFMEDNQKMSQVYYEQALNQINDYVEEYGKANGYDYIYGASGNGSLMYAKEENDITDQVLAYINQKYHGK